MNEIDVGEGDIGCTLAFYFSLLDMEHRSIKFLLSLIKKTKSLNNYIFTARTIGNHHPWIKNIIAPAMNAGTGAVVGTAVDPVQTYAFVRTVACIEAHSALAY